MHKKGKKENRQKVSKVFDWQLKPFTDCFYIDFVFTEKVSRGGMETKLNMRY